MLWLFGWIVYGLIVGLIAKALHPGDDPVGFLPTIGIGIAGSYVGGAINWVLGRGGPFEPSGIALGIVGGIIFCWIYSRYRLNRLFEAQKKKIEEWDGGSQDD